MRRRAILVDVTKCAGCNECTTACQRANKQPEHAATKLDEQTFTYLLQVDKDVQVRRLCMHCQNPSCASVCPVTALRKTPEGPVTYDADKCMGCRYCMVACPFNVPTYEWRSVKPRIRKCQMCAPRGAKGPACAEACPAEATITGERDALIAAAKKRLAEGPRAYYQHIYGLTEAGGTDVLYIGPRGPKALGLPTNVRTEAHPELTWRALRHVPDIVLFGSVLLGGVYWLTNRRGDVRRMEDGEEEE